MSEALSKEGVTDTEASFGDITKRKILEANRELEGVLEDKDVESPKLLDAIDKRQGAARLAVHIMHLEEDGTPVTKESLTKAVMDELRQTAVGLAYQRNSPHSTITPESISDQFAHLGWSLRIIDSVTAQ